ncbi:hypothetical protein [Pseudonocardia alaniniphila]|uniref:Phytanoyl-CoA dioxygenase PhyH n=1 Tax=Pseudonocardia alaniniphila TaxID=75291 RepID=A0ABS9TGN3_9PSEU|nr:hypothetical protein [Pseudonocardia alaniniphila]MCH6167672.1 hypothetical protein [Pseudonocardia alaniniphila]
MLNIAPLGGDGFVVSQRLVHRSDANRSDRDRRALLYLFQPAGRPHPDESGRA